MTMRALFLFVSFTVCLHAKEMPLNEFNYFFKTNTAPNNATIDWPQYHSSTLTIDVQPLERVLNTAEVTVFGSSIKLFYEQIFDSQTEYSLKCRMVEVIQQGMKRDNTLSVQTLIAVNFRPTSVDQVLTNDELKRILLHLVNKYNDHLVGYLQTQHLSFKNVATVNARLLEVDNSITTQDDNFWKNNQWSIVTLTVGGIVIVGALLASFRLYKREIGFSHGLLREWRHPPKYVQPETWNSSHFQEEDSGNKDTVNLDDEENDSYELENKYAFRPSEHFADLDSPPGPPDPFFIDMTVPRSRSTRYYVEAEWIAPLEPELSRTELWAPAGKLGVAIDMVNGQPVVHSLKPGSPLEGFLSKGDRIVQIDEVDTSMMSSADVTSLMVRRMNERRKIVYIRADALA